MSRNSILRWSVLALLPLIVAPARAEYEPTPCRHVFDAVEARKRFDAAFAALEQCERDYTGVVPIARRVARGEQVVRAYIAHGERAMPLLIEFVRRGSRVRLEIGALAAGHRRRVLPVERSDFDALLAHWRNRASDRAPAEEEPARRKQADDAKGFETVCIDSGFGARVEVADGREVHDVALRPCVPGDYVFVDDLIATALRNSGRCATPPSLDDGGPIDRLLACVPWPR